MNKKQIKTLTSVIVVIIALAVGYFGSGRLHLGQGNNSATDNSSQVSTKSLASSVKQAPLTFKNQRQMVMANTDALGRAVDSHIQLKDSQEPKVKREPLT